MELAEFRAYAKVSNVIPVSRKLLADSETPLGVYKKLAKSAATCGSRVVMALFCLIQ